MKYLLILAASVAISSCAGLAGTSISFTEKGFTVTPPTVPVVVPYPSK